MIVSDVYIVIQLYVYISKSPIYSEFHSKSVFISPVCL